MTTGESGRSVLIVGATSAIAHECAKRFAAEGTRFFLVARNAERLDAVARDLEVRGAGGVSRFVADLTDLSRHEAMVAAARERLGELDFVLVAHGSLPDQRQCESDAGLVMRELATNATSTICLLTVLADAMSGGRRVASLSSPPWPETGAGGATTCTEPRRRPSPRFSRDSARGCAIREWPS